MKKFYLYLLIFLFLFVLVVLAVLLGPKTDELSKIDLKETGFEYDLPVCKKYFEMVECIIEKAPADNLTKQMRIDFKNEVKKMNEKWKTYNEDELLKTCTEELSYFETGEIKNDLESFGCSL